MSGSDRQREVAALVMALPVAIQTYPHQYILDCSRGDIHTVETGLGE